MTLNLFCSWAKAIQEKKRAEKELRRAKRRQRNICVINKFLDLHRAIQCNVTRATMPEDPMSVPEVHPSFADIQTLDLKEINTTHSDATSRISIILERLELIAVSCRRRDVSGVPLGPGAQVSSGGNSSDLGSPWLGQCMNVCLKVFLWLRMNITPKSEHSSIFIGGAVAFDSSGASDLVNCGWTAEALPLLLSAVIRSVRAVLDVSAARCEASNKLEQISEEVFSAFEEEYKAHPGVGRLILSREIEIWASKLLTVRRSPHLFAVDFSGIYVQRNRFADKFVANSIAGAQERSSSSTVDSAVDSSGPALFCLSLRGSPVVTNLLRISHTLLMFSIRSANGFAKLTSISKVDIFARFKGSRNCFHLGLNTSFFICFASFQANPEVAESRQGYVHRAGVLMSISPSITSNATAVKTAKELKSTFIGLLDTCLFLAVQVAENDTVRCNGPGIGKDSLLRTRLPQVLTHICFPCISRYDSIAGQSSRSAVAHVTVDASPLMADFVDMESYEAIAFGRIAVSLGHYTGTSIKINIF